MSEKNESIASFIRTASYLNRTIPIPLLIFGTIGNVLNIVILTRKPLRTNSCSFYFLSATIANVISLWIGLLTRSLSGYNLDPTVWNTYICKFRYFITYMCLALSACFLVYASIDRWASSNSSVHIRLFSRIHVARRMVMRTIIIACLLYGQAFYCYSTATIQSSLTCYCPNIICRMFNDIIFLILFSIIPPILMLTFGWRTIQNVKKKRRQVNPNIVQNNRRYHLMKKKDRQMITMLFIQVIVFAVCVIPSGASKTYSTFTFNRNKDPLESTKETFSFQVAALILYINCCCAFYIYTLTGTIFRREVRRLLTKLHLLSTRANNTFNLTQASTGNR